MYIVYVIYKLIFCTSYNLYKKSVQIAICTNSLHKLQLVQIDLYNFQDAHILDLYKFHVLLVVQYF